MTCVGTIFWYHECYLAQFAQTEYSMLTDHGLPFSNDWDSCKKKQMRKLRPNGFERYLSLVKLFPLSVRKWHVFMLKLKEILTILNHVSNISAEGYEKVELGSFNVNLS